MAWILKKLLTLVTLTLQLIAYCKKKLKKSVKNNKKIKFVYAPQEIVLLNVFKANYYQLWIYLVNYLDFQTPRIQKLQTTTEGTI